jgi:hypothetical protein
LIVQLIGIAIVIFIVAAVGFSFLTNFGDDIDLPEFE